MKWRPWYTVVALSALGWIVIYAGRSVLSPVLGAVGREWGLNEGQLGLIPSVFFLAYSAGGRR